MVGIQIILCTRGNNKYAVRSETILCERNVAAQHTVVFIYLLIFFLYLFIYILLWLFSVTQTI
jgi:hypothetical protein